MSGTSPSQTPASPTPGSPTAQLPHLNNNLTEDFANIDPSLRSSVANLNSESLSAELGPQPISSPLGPASLKAARPLSGFVTAQKVAQLVQYAAREIASKNLKDEVKEGYLKWTKAGPDEREATMGAMLFSIESQLKLLKQSSGIEGTKGSLGQWEPPLAALKGIDKFAIRLLLSPDISEYNGEGVLESLMNIVERKASAWNLPQNMKHFDEEKWDFLVSKGRYNLTQRRAEIKKGLMTSIGRNDGSKNSRSTGSPPPVKHWHIYQLCKHLTTSIGSKSGFNTNLQVTVELCARVAFLNQAEIDRSLGKSRSGQQNRYWEFVDQSLAKIREASQGNIQTIHEGFVQILKEDQKLYPLVGSGAHSNVLVSLRGVNPNEMQGYVNQFALTGEIHSISATTED
ncbi:hypothetical protein C8Q79DRAFT_928354 [Trametes meyenii]|nr:hypothetical protein C8Q79DRAFT_928354 [Trametes meyenii]